MLNSRASWSRFQALLAVCTIGICLHPDSLRAATFGVPADFPAIQQAIDAAATGDSILVQPGTFNETLDTHGKNLTVIGVGGRDVTIVDAVHTGRVLMITGGGWWEGFTLKNGKAPDRGAGVFIRGTTPTRIRRNMIAFNAAGGGKLGHGGGIALDDFVTAQNVIVEENDIHDNTAGDTGGGVYASGYVLTNVIRNNSIHDNRAGLFGGGLVLEGGLAVGNLILRNTATIAGGGVYMFYGELRNNTIVRSNPEPAFDGSATALVFGDGVVVGNVVAFNSGPFGRSVGIRCGSAGAGEFRCNVAWGNGGDDFVLSGGCDTTGTGNVSADPLFCDPASDNYAVAAASPCAPAHSNGCGLIGAVDVDPACGATQLRRMTWGALKAHYR